MATDKLQEVTRIETECLATFTQFKAREGKRKGKERGVKGRGGEGMEGCPSLGSLDGPVTYADLKHFPINISVPDITEMVLIR